MPWFVVVRPGVSLLATSLLLQFDHFIPRYNSSVNSLLKHLRGRFQACTKIPVICKAEFEISLMETNDDGDDKIEKTGR